MTTFLLIVSRAEGLDGKWVPAKEMASRRLEAKQWGLYSNTRCRREIAVGDEIIVYLAGTGLDTRHFVAKAVIAIINRTVKEYKGDGGDVLTDRPTSILELEHIEWFKNPVSIYSIKEKLNFIPKNNPKWGCVLQGGARKITQTDRDLIVSSQKHPVKNRP